MRRLIAFIACAGAIVALGGTAQAAAAPAAVSRVAACTPTQVIGNGGFESGTAPWTASANVIFTGGGQSAHTGTRFARLGGLGSTHTDTLSQPVTLPAGCNSATLSFWLHIDTTETTASTAFDKLTPKIGSTTLATYSNLDKNTGYAQKTIDVSAFAGQTVTLTFTGTEDPSLVTNFVLDDVALDVSGGAPPGDSTRTPASPAYTVNLTSNASGATWTGHQSVSFTNASATPLTEVYLRLWDNFHGTCPSNTPITVSNVTGGTAGALTVACTALKVTLPAPLNQGQSGAVGFDLQIVVPAGVDRFGRDGAYNFIGNALPVLAIRDAAGWHLDPYTNNGESFYSLAGDFHVTLDHPTSLLIPATGTSVTAPGSAGRTITTATATKVRDFAWGAGPFVKTSSTSGAGVNVNVFRVSAVSAASATSMMNTARAAVDAHATRFGAYPYGEADIVLDNNFWFGGMEYPGFILNVISSTALAHELGHQWWYGIVGDDEYTSPWLDESFTDYSTDLYNGITGTNCWNNVSWQSSAEKITNSMAYWDAHSSRYSTVVYTYGKCALHDLRRLLGDATMTTLLRNYAQSHWYGVSTTAEFKAAAQAATSTNLSAFWTQHRIDG